MVVTWDLALEFAACETSRERESKISARGARKGGKRQRTETQRATVSTRRVRRLFSVLDDFVIGRAAAKRSLCSTRVVFLSFSCTYTSFFFCTLRSARAGMNSAPPHLILLSGLSKCNQSANSISAQVRHASTQFPQITGRLLPKCKVTQQGAVLVSVECPESLRLSKALLGLLPGCDRYYAEQSPEAIYLTLGRYAGSDVEGFEQWLDRSLESQLDLLPRFRGTCIQLSDEARPFPNPRLALMGSLASASKLVAETTATAAATTTTTTTTTAVGGLGDRFGGFGSGGLGGLHGDAVPQRNTNFDTDYDAASSILASVGSGGAGGGGGLGLGFGGSAWGAGGGAFGGGVFSTSPVGTGSSGGGHQQSGAAPGSYSAGGGLSSSASSALGGGNMIGGSGVVAAMPATSGVVGTGGAGQAGGPAPPLGPRPVGVPGFTSGLGSSLVGAQQQQHQPQRPPGGPTPPGGLSPPGGAPVPPSAPRPTSWASIAKSTATVAPENAGPARVAASRAPPGGAIPQPQVPKGPPPPSNLRAAYAPNTDPSSIAHSTRPGDWYCENCNAHNFASRNACFKCKEIKKNVTPVMQPPPQASSPTGSSGGGMEREFVPPPPLGNPSAAGAKQADDYDVDIKANGYSHNGGVEAALRPGDWLCAGCRAHNFASRVVCFKCKTRKSGSLSEGPPSSREQRDDEDDGRGGFPMRSGDWLCDSCGAHNFASRGTCFKCKK